MCLDEYDVHIVFVLKTTKSCSYKLYKVNFVNVEILRYCLKLRHILCDFIFVFSYAFAREDLAVLCSFKKLFLFWKINPLCINSGCGGSATPLTVPLILNGHKPRFVPTISSTLFLASAIDFCIAFTQKKNK